MGIESYDTYLAKISSSIIRLIRYIEVSRYHEVSVYNVHKYRDTSIHRVSRYFDISSIEPALSCMHVNSYTQHPCQLLKIHMQSIPKHRIFDNKNDSTFEDDSSTWIAKSATRRHLYVDSAASIAIYRPGGPGGQKHSQIHHTYVRCRRRGHCGRYAVGATSPPGATISTLRASMKEQIKSNSQLQPVRLRASKKTFVVVCLLTTRAGTNICNHISYED